jgi:hypothetical protein
MTAFECPYCGGTENPSKDHIFSDFFGGRQTIDACRECNSRFGHEFEGRFINALAPMIVSLAVCGLKPKRKVTWKDAFVDLETGIKYDVNSDLFAIAPVQWRVLEGGVRAMTATDPRIVERHVENFKKQGKKISISRLDSKSMRPEISFPVHFDDNMKRTAVKMCIALLDHFEYNQVVHPQTIDYLLNGESGPIPAGIACVSYPALDALREPLSHVIYVQGMKKRKFLYGIVQFFGVLQVYCILNGQYRGEDLSLLGTLNSINFLESFAEAPALNLQLPYGDIPADDYWTGMWQMFRKFDEQIGQVFGQNVLIFGKPIL